MKTKAFSAEAWLRELLICYIYKDYDADVPENIDDIADEAIQKALKGKLKSVDALENYTLEQAELSLETEEEV